MPVDVLIIGEGAREHALAWKLRASPRLGKLYCAPGNGGTEKLAKNVPINQKDITELAKFAINNNIGLTIVGPDEPLAAGIVDLFKSHNLRIFGPTKAGSKIESSKSFGKQIMREANIPTAASDTCSEFNQALNSVRRRHFPVVIKASGLARGKGVFICNDIVDAEVVLRSLLVEKTLGDAGSEVVIEDHLDGAELSLHAFSDGSSLIILPPAQDHKKIGEGDTGKNTGGMGVIAPVPWLTHEQKSFTEHRIIKPALEALTSNGIYYQGILYPGVKVTVDGIKALEFNARFGDPECQAYMRLMASDILPILEACVDGSIADMAIDWRYGFAAVITLASAGYPDTFKTGFQIEGIKDAIRVPEVVVFHAGTIEDKDGLRTAGGRVLSVSAVGPTLKEAIDRAYEAVGKISFEGMYYRKDIGAQSLKYDRLRT